MKKQFLLSLVVLLGITLTSQAQSVGVLAQPNLNQDYLGTGFFAEHTIIKDLGVYADYKFNSNYNSNSYTRRQIDQANIGISYKVSDFTKIIVSTSLVHKVKYSTAIYNAIEEQMYTGSQSVNLGNTLGVSGLFGVNSSVHGLVGFETNRSFTDNRITFGLGVSLY